MKATIKGSTPDFYRYPNVMIDIETLGTKTNCVIGSIGILEFDIRTGEILSEYDVNVDFQSSLDAGLKVDGSTLQFWMSQSEEARAHFFRDPKPLAAALAYLEQFLDIVRDEERKVCIWSNSPLFDIVRLEESFTAVGRKIPWKYWEHWDVRSVSGLNPRVKGQHRKPSKETAHTPLEDCRNQVEYLVAVLNSIYK